MSAWHSVAQTVFAATFGNFRNCSFDRYMQLRGFREQALQELPSMSTLRFAGKFTTVLWLLAAFYIVRAFKLTIHVQVIRLFQVW